MTRYAYTVEKQSDGMYLLQFVDFPTAFAEGETQEEVESYAKDILEGIVEEYTDSGLKFPIPSNVGSRKFVEV